MSPHRTRLEFPNSAYFRGIARISCSVVVASSPSSKLQLAVLPPLVPSRRSRAQLAHLRYADLGSSRPSDHHGALVDARVHLGPPGSICHSSVSRRFRQAQCSRCSTHHIHRGGPVLIGRQDCAPASSGKSQSSQRHHDSQPVFVVMFRRQVAHVAVSADLLQRELPRLYGIPSPEPLHVQVSHSPRSNSVVHAEVCGTVREYFQLRLHSSLNQQLD